MALTLADEIQRNFRRLQTLGVTASKESDGC